MSSDEEFGIGEVAALAGISVRTLHHYDAIGLLSPSARTAAGHRKYSATDLSRLREILFYRALDFGLDEIAAILADPGTGAESHLREQHRLLRERIDTYRQLLTALEKEMEARRMGISLTPEEQFEIFGSDKYTGEYADEARERWGDTDAWRESNRRTTAYTKADWQQIRAEADEIVAAFAAELRAGTPATAPAARTIAERHREHLGRWFYECSPPFHRNLGELYVADDRFRRNYEKVAPGLAEYVRDAIVANADGALS